LRFLPLTETFIYNEATSIKAYRVLVFCAQRQNADKFPYNDVRSVSDLSLPFYALNGVMLRLSLGCPYFSGVISKEDVRLLHAHYGPTGTRMLPLKRRHGIPLITSFRGMDASLLPSKDPGMYDRLFDEGDLFLARSQDMVKDLETLGCPKGKAVAHHSGIMLDDFRHAERLAEEEVVFLTVARLAQNKGVQDAVEAFATVNREHPHTRLRIVGEGPQRGELEKLIRSLDLEGMVELAGAMPHNKVLDEMLKAHVFVLPSFTTSEGEKEGIPNALMEAQATGMPVVSTRHAGIPELVSDGKTGLLVDERDIAGLASKMSWLVDNAGQWGKMGREGRRRVEEEFDILMQCAKIEAIYARFIGD